MSRIRRFFPAAALIAAVLSSGACLNVHIARHVADPTSYFEDAQRQIRNLERDHPGRRGAVHDLHVLAYDGRNGDLVQVTVPLWLVRTAVRLGEDDEMERARGDRFWNGYHFDHRVLRELDSVGPGLLVDIEEDLNSVLIWLE